MPTEFKMIRRVTFAETDLAGVMHFSNYYRWMEEIEHAFFRSLGLCIVQEHGDRTYSWPRVITSCEYFAPARFEEEIDLHLVLMDLSEKSMTYEVAFSRGAARVARGRVKAVCCVMKDGQFSSTAIPPFIREKLAGLGS